MISEELSGYSSRSRRRIAFDVGEDFCEACRKVVIARSIDMLVSPGSIVPPARMRRYEKDRPGELIHVDTKQVARIPDGGGWWAHGIAYGNTANPAANHRATSMSMLRSMTTPGSPTQKSSPTKGETCAGFWKRAQQFFADHGITVVAVMTDNWTGYRSNVFAAALGAIEHVRTRPYRPQTNGKVERFNRTLVEEWAYARPYTSEADRTHALQDWNHLYNHHRGHSAIGGPPIDRVDNLPGSYN